jgi:hypothetical protein
MMPSEKILMEILELKTRLTLKVDLNFLNQVVMLLNKVLATDRKNGRPKLMVRDSIQAMISLKTAIRDRDFD